MPRGARRKIGGSALIVQVHGLKILRQRYAPSKGSFNLGLERGGSLRFPMSEVDLPRRSGEAGEPAQKLALPRVRGKLPQIDDFRADRDILAMDPYGFRALFERPAARSFRLKPGQENGVLAVRGEACNVVK